MGHIETRVDHQAQLTTHTVHGEITAGEIIEKVREYYRGDVTKKTLWNFLDASSARITGQEMRDLATVSSEHSAQRAGGKSALVFGREAEFGLGRMFEFVNSFRDSKVEYASFMDLDAALRWLGIPGEHRGP
jgi:hypothetical protein